MAPVPSNATPLNTIERRTFHFVAHSYAERRHCTVARTVFAYETFGKECLFFSLHETGGDVYFIHNDTPEACYYGIHCGAMKPESVPAGVRGKLGLAAIPNGN